MTTPRALQIKIEPVAGTLNQLIVWLNGTPVIRTNGKAGEWNGTLGDRVTLEVAAWGQGSAKYRLTIDLPGTADDQKLEFTLTAGYHDAQLQI